jgi:PEGA domain-containing protein
LVLTGRGPMARRVGRYPQHVGEDSCEAGRPSPGVQSMTRNAWLVGLLLAAGLAGGCVERRFVVYSDPPGALVYVNGQYVGASPADYYYVYYGKYHIRLVRDGYETLDVIQNVRVPWYELPGADLIAETFIPFKIRDTRNFCYTLQPLQAVRADDVANRAAELRSRGQAIGTPREPRPVPAAPPGSAPPAPAAPAVPPLGPPQTPGPQGM